MYLPGNEGQETERIYNYWGAQLKHWYDNHNDNVNQNQLVCTDEDFETAMVISTKLLLNAADAYNQIGGKDQLAVGDGFEDNQLGGGVNSHQCFALVIIILCKSQVWSDAKFNGEFT